MIFFLLLLLYWAGMFVFFQVKKESIRQQLSDQISEIVKGEFTISDLKVNFFSTFPNIALSMRDVEMKDSAWNLHQVSLLKAKKILFRINPFSLVRGDVRVSKIVVEDGTLHAFTNGEGFTNEYLLSPKSTSTRKRNNKKGFHLEEIALKNVRVIRSNAIKSKLFDISVKRLKCNLDNFNSGYLMEVKLDAVVSQLAFNTAKGAYLKGKTLSGEFDLRFDTATKLLQFEKIGLNADGQRLFFTGKFHLGLEKKFTLQIEGDRIQYAKGVALLPEKISAKLSKYNVNVPMNVMANIDGRLVFRSPTKVRIKTAVKNAVITTEAGDFTNTNFSAEFFNALNDTLPYVDQNSRLLFTNFTSNWEGVQLNSKKLTITNLVNPFMEADLTTSTDLPSLNKLLGSSSFDFTSGDINAKVNYAGALFSDTTTSITGEMVISGGTVTYAPRQVKLDKINGRFEFQNSDVIIKNLSADAEGNKVNINATVRNMVNMLSTDPSKLFVEASVTSPYIDLKSFRRMVGNRRKVQTTSQGKFGRIAERIDRFMEDCSITTQLKAEKLKYNSFNAADVTANFSMNSEAWNIKEVSLAHSNGTINISGTLTSKETNYNIATMNVNMLNLDVSKVFQAFDNFGLASLHSENLRGKLTSNMRLTAVLDDESNVLPALLQGSIFLSLKDGELINFEPLQKMSVFVLKKRDFSHLQFAELRDSFEINGSKLTIHKMEIQSNVLGLLLEGIYDIKGQATDLVVQVPLKYLKKRDPGYVPENQGLDARRGVSIYVRATNGDNGEIDFKYGLFKKKSILEKNQKKANSIP